MKKTMTWLMLLAVLLGASACGNSEKLLESTKEEKKTVMVVGNYDVPYEVYRYVTLNIKDAYEAGGGEDIWLGESGAVLIEELNADVKDTVAHLYTPLILAEEYGISVEDELIKDAVELAMDGMYEAYEYDYKAYDEAISASHMNDGVYRFLQLNETVSEELFHAMIGTGEILTDEEALSEIFRSDEFIRVKQILVSSENGNTKEENRARAEELLSMAEGGADFDELVQRHGQDLSMFNNPDGMYMMKGTYYEAFEEAAFSLDVGEMSGIVETPAGFSIIRRYEKEEAYMTEHAEDMTDTYQSSVYNLRLEKALASVTVAETELLADYSIFTLE